MLEQVIYTRCLPCRSLENGQVMHKEGLGFYSVSEGLISSIPERIKLDRLIRKQNCSKTRAAGYVCSYSLLSLGGGNTALTYEVPRENTGEKRANGNLIRTGNYIKQCLIGRPCDYPYKWFGSAVFDAHKRPQQDYYHDLDPKSEPPYLSQVSDRAGDGYVNDKVIDDFLSDNRQELFVKMLAFILQQMTLPAGERRVLLIKDTPENVELWVAAIERSVSVSIALEISFDTNISGITGNNSNGELFYYVNQKTGAVCSYDSRINTLERLPYAMIAGIHPKDTMSAGIRKTAISNYEIADPAQGSFTADMGEYTQRQYFTHAALHDGYITEFCSEFLPYVDTAGADVAALFDAYALLLTDLGSARKGYDEVYSALKSIIGGRATGSEALDRKLFETGLAGYGRFFEQDEDMGYGLLSLYSTLADRLGEKGRVEEKLLDRFTQLCDKLPESSGVLCRSWAAFEKNGSEAFRQNIMRGLFTERRVERCVIVSSMIDAATDRVLFDMLIEGLPADAEHFANHEELCILAGALLSGCIDDERLITAMLDTLSKSEELFCFFAGYTAEFMGSTDPNGRREWLEVLVRYSGSDPEKLCARLFKSPYISIDIIESILCIYAKRIGRVDEKLHSIFECAVAAMPEDDFTGLEFYRCCIELTDDTGMMQRVISKAMRAGLDEDVQRRVYIYLNKRLFARKEPLTQELLSVLEAWSERLCISSLVLEKELLIETLETVTSARPALGACERFIKIRFDLPQGYTKSDMFLRVTDSAVQFNDGLFYLYAMFLFDSDDDDALAETAEAFISTILKDNAKSKHLGELLFGMREAFTLDDAHVPSYEGERVRQVQEILKAAFEKCVKASYRSSMTEQVRKAGGVNEADRQALLLMLGEASGSKGGIKGIFRHKNT